MYLLPKTDMKWNYNFNVFIHTLTKKINKTLTLSPEQITTHTQLVSNIILENKNKKNSRFSNIVSFITWFITALSIIWLIAGLYWWIQQTSFGLYDEYILPLIVIIVSFFLIPKWERQKKARIQKSLNRSSKVKNIFLLLLHFLFFWFLFIYIWKSFFIDSNYFIFYLYWVSVTFTHLLVFYVALFRYEDPWVLAKQVEEKMIEEWLKPKQPLVSCLIAVFNEEKVISTCIDSMVAQTYQNREIIFINDCSTDNTAEVLDGYADKWLIKVIHLEKNQWKKRALWIGIRQAQWTLLAMSDSDCTWNTDVLEIIVRVFNVFPNVWWLSGHWRALNPYDTFITKIQDSWYEWQFSIRKAFESVFGSITCVSWPLAIFRREAIYNYIPAWENDSFLGAPFRFATDRTLTWYVLGSSVIWESLKKDYHDIPFTYNRSYPDRDWDIVYCKSAKSLTVVPDTFRRLVKQHARWKKSFIRNIFHTGKFYWKKPFLASVIYYLHIILVLVWPIVAARHLLYLPYTWDWWSPLIYIWWIFFVWTAFGIAFKLEDRESNLWRYRPFMSIFSTMVLSWLIIYSLFTLKEMTWSRD